MCACNRFGQLQKSKTHQSRTLMTNGLKIAENKEKTRSKRDFLSFAKFYSVVLFCGVFILFLANAVAKLCMHWPIKEH